MPLVRLRPLDEWRIALEGDCTGSLDLRRRIGTVSGEEPLGAMDALLRLAVSLLAPGRGWILLHGAAVEATQGGWILLVGRPGSGKSTAAASFVSFCDELVLVRPLGEGAEAASTPYWGGIHGRAPCRAVVSLERAIRPGLRRCTAAGSLRTMLPHVMRFLPHDETDRSIFERLGALTARVDVFRASCPVGAGFIPYLGTALGDVGLEPARRNGREV